MDKWTETGNFQAYGPFVLKEWNHNQSLTLVRNPYWPGTPEIPVPAFDEITWDLKDNSMALDNYKSGQLDLLSASWSDQAAILGDAKLKNQLLTSQAGCVNWLAFNTSQPPLDKPEVRKALFYGLGSREAGYPTL